MPTKSKVEIVIDRNGYDFPKAFKQAAKRMREEKCRSTAKKKLN
jgi:hypothetical protein